MPLKSIVLNKLFCFDFSMMHIQYKKNQTKYFTAASFLILFGILLKKYQFCVRVFRGFCVNFVWIYYHGKSIKVKF